MTWRMFLQDAASGFTIVRSPQSSVAKNEMKSKLDRIADRILERHGYDPAGRAKTPKRKRRMYGKLQQVWPVVLEARSRGESVASIARKLRVKPHTIAYHLAVESAA